MAFQQVDFFDENGFVEIETPICKTTVKELKGKKMAIVPILRAGLGMVDGMLSLIPAAKVGHRRAGGGTSRKGMTPQSRGGISRKGMTSQSRRRHLPQRYDIAEPEAAPAAKV